MSLDFKSGAYRPAPPVRVLEVTNDNLIEIVDLLSGSNPSVFKVSSDGASVYRTLDGGFSFKVGDFLVFDENLSWLDALSPEEFPQFFELTDEAQQ